MVFLLICKIFLYFPVTSFVISKNCSFVDGVNKLNFFNVIVMNYSNGLLNKQKNSYYTMLFSRQFFDAFIFKGFDSLHDKNWRQRQ